MFFVIPAHSWRFLSSRCLFALSISALLSLGACQPVSQNFQPETHTPSLQAEVLLAVDGATLPLKRWLPKGKPKAVIVALHGFNDYSNAFATPAAYFALHGIATFAYDQRGFGGAPSRGIWAGENNLVRDAKEAVRAVHAAYPQIPIYVLGESMGGAVAVLLAAEPNTASPLSGIILSGPALWGGESMNWLYQGTLWIGAHTIRSYTVTGRGLKILASDNIPMLIALGQDPLVIKETRLDAIYGLVGVMDHAYAHIEKVQTPMLALYGARDQVIPPEPVYHSLLRIDGPHRIAYYPEGYHMLLRDLQGKTVQRDIVSWIENPAAPLPSGFDESWQERMKKTQE